MGLPKNGAVVMIVQLLCTFALLSATYYCKSTHAARENCANRALRLKEIHSLPPPRPPARPPFSATSVVEGEKPAAKKRVSYMSEEELREKLSQEQNRRKNAERRLDYLRKKVEEEMKTFQGEDHKDFLNTFHSVEKESLNADMKVFWEAQEKALLQTSSKGYRWHPKLVAFICLIKKLLDGKE